MDLRLVSGDQIVFLRNSTHASIKEPVSVLSLMKITARKAAAERDMKENYVVAVRKVILEIHTTNARSVLTLQSTSSLLSFS